MPQHYFVDFENDIVRLPQIGAIKAVLHRKFEGELKTFEVQKNLALLQNLCKLSQLGMLINLITKKMVHKGKNYCLKLRNII